MAYLLLVVAFVVNAFATICLKLNATRGTGFGGSLSVDMVTGNAYLFLGLALFATNVIFYYLALRVVPLSLAYPIMVTGTFVVVGLASVFIFHEHIGVTHVVGYLLVITGISVVSLLA